MVAGLVWKIKDNYVVHAVKGFPKLKVMNILTMVNLCFTWNSDDDRLLQWLSFVETQALLVLENNHC